MNLRYTTRLGFGLLVGAIAPLAAPELAQAAHIARNLDVNITRPKLGANEGYLNFLTTNPGDEYTGHTDKTGRDWADNWFTVKPIIVKDKNGDKPNKAEPANINNDFEFMRKIYAQAGLSVRQESTSSVSKADFPGIGDFPFDFTEEVALANNGAGRSGNAKTINLYYANELNGNLNGVTRARFLAGADNTFSYVSDSRVNNTAAHEIGHMLLNDRSSFWDDDGTGGGHTKTDKSNLMWGDGTQSATKLEEVGQKLSATVGGHDILEHRKDDAKQEQITRIHGNNEFVTHANYNDTHGDIADFDWVSDHRLIETLMGGGNGADHNPGVDFLIWEINAPQVKPSQHKGPAQDKHDHGNLGCNPLQIGPCSLNLPAFNQPFFKTIDIVSNINLFADNDIDPTTGKISNREKALDYHIPDFSTDLKNWFPGTLLNVFTKGWTEDTKQEDYISRWTTDIDAKYVRLSAVGAGIVGHDGNTQIDAIIAFDSRVKSITVPEPSTIFGLATVLGLGTLFNRKGSKNQKQANTKE